MRTELPDKSPSFIENIYYDRVRDDSHKNYFEDIRDKRSRNTHHNSTFGHETENIYDVLYGSGNKIHNSTQKTDKCIKEIEQELPPETPYPQDKRDKDKHIQKRKDETEITRSKYEPVNKNHHKAKARKQAGDKVEETVYVQSIDTRFSTADNSIFAGREATKGTCKLIIGTVPSGGVITRSEVIKLVVVLLLELVALGEELIGTVKSQARLDILKITVETGSHGIKASNKRTLKITATDSHVIIRHRAGKRNRRTYYIIGRRMNISKRNTDIKRKLDPESHRMKTGHLEGNSERTAPRSFMLHTVHDKDRDTNNIVDTDAAKRATVRNNGGRFQNTMVDNA